MTLPPAVADWPADAREDYEERAAIVRCYLQCSQAWAEELAERMIRQKYAARASSALHGEQMCDTQAATSPGQSSNSP